MSQFFFLPPPLDGQMSPLDPHLLPFVSLRKENKSRSKRFFLLGGGGASQLANEQLNEEMRPIKVIAIVMMVIMTMSHRVSCFSFIFLALGKNTMR